MTEGQRMELEQLENPVVTTLLQLWDAVGESGDALNTAIDQALEDEREIDAVDLFTIGALGEAWEHE